ncbi:hypothetical protein BOTBODRAFT_70712 [Botryobasidium botryosum FD-172 SS1]|uniref:Protein kinase domain-containing protein n=1 Tax=Botryobasidium botryosum (strain FD-172 SS1) TaxID=930990 RepID=A0A067M5U1_BOTB1|nr:hypothetical protein BOTBODRAFT_70712 [Botryobasidium botryosum FD-172 SS1]
MSSSNHAAATATATTLDSVPVQSFIPPIPAGVEIMVDAQPSRVHVDGEGEGGGDGKGKESSRSESSDVDSERESGAVTVSFKSIGQWEFMNGKDVEEVEVLQHIGGGARTRVVYAKGKAAGKHIAFVRKQWDEQYHGAGMHAEVYLYSSPYHLKLLQGIIVPRVISASIPDEGAAVLNMEPISQRGWTEAHPKFMSTSDKEVVIRTYMVLHAQGILHNDVALRHILLSDDGLVHLVDFTRARSTRSCRLADLPLCTQAELDLELRRVKWVLEYDDAHHTETQRWEDTDREVYQRNCERRAARERGVCVPMLSDEVWDAEREECRVWDVRAAWVRDYVEPGEEVRRCVPEVEVPEDEAGRDRLDMCREAALLQEWIGTGTFTGTEEEAKRFPLPAQWPPLSALPLLRRKAKIAPVVARALSPEPVLPPGRDSRPRPDGNTRRVMFKDVPNTPAHPLRRVVPLPYPQSQPQPHPRPQPPQPQARPIPRYVHDPHPSASKLAAAGVHVKDFAEDDAEGKKKTQRLKHLEGEVAGLLRRMEEFEREEQRLREIREASPASTRIESSPEPEPAPAPDSSDPARKPALGARPNRARPPLPAVVLPRDDPFPSLEAAKEEMARIYGHLQPYRDALTTYKSIRAKAAADAGVIRARIEERQRAEEMAAAMADKGTCLRSVGACGGEPDGEGCGEDNSGGILRSSRGAGLFAGIGSGFETPAPKYIEPSTPLTDDSPDADVGRRDDDFRYSPVSPSPSRPLLRRTHTVLFFPSQETPGSATVSASTSYERRSAVFPPILPPLRAMDRDSGTGTPSPTKSRGKKRQLDHGDGISDGAAESAAVERGMLLEGGRMRKSPRKSVATKAGRPVRG